MNTPKTALILGASGTLGKAIAQALFQKEYALGLQAFRHPENLPAFTPLTEALAPQSYGADFRDPQETEKLAKDFLADFGRIDALVWAAGIATGGLALSLSEEELREVLAVDLTAPYFLMKGFSRQFLKQRSGSVVVLASHAGLSGRVGGAAYAMAQSGLLALVKSLAREWGASGVRVNAVVPPFIPQSGMGQASAPEFAQAVKAKNVLKAPSLLDREKNGELAAGQPARVAQFVANLVEGASTSGQVFVLDSRIA